jgi:hypothetical protein
MMFRCELVKISHEANMPIETSETFLAHEWVRQHMEATRTPMGWRNLDDVLSMYIKPLQHCSAVALGCSIARGWIQLSLLFIMEA